PASFAVSTMPTTPPAGPESNASLPWNMSAAVRPPEDIMNISLGFSFTAERSLCSLADPFFCAPLASRRAAAWPADAPSCTNSAGLRPSAEEVDDWLTSSLVGEMPGRAEGGVETPNSPATWLTYRDRIGDRYASTTVVSPRPTNFTRRETSWRPE